MDGGQREEGGSMPFSCGEWENMVPLTSISTSLWFVWDMFGV